MEYLIFFVCLILALVFLPIRVAVKKNRIYLPDAFLATNLILFIGSFALWFGHHSTGTSFLTTVSGVALISMTLAQLFVFLFTTQKREVNRGLLRTKFSQKNHTRGLLLILLINALILAIIFSNSGVRLLLIAAFTQSDQTLLAARKSITASTEGYLAPGIIKELRDILGPVIICSYMIITKNWRFQPLFWLTLILLIGCMLVSGQRFPVMVTALSVGIIAMTTGNAGSRRFKPTGLVLYGTLGLISFSALSRLLGRTDQNLSFIGGLQQGAKDLFERLFTIVPGEAIKTFDYWSNIGPTNGQSWIADLSILLPIAAGNTFSNDLHSYGGGSEEGNAPLFFAVDAWFAFGYAGVITASISFIILINIIDRFLWKYRTPFNDATRLIVFFYLYLAYSPYLFLLNGGLVAFLAIGISVLTVRKKLRRTNYVL